MAEEVCEHCMFPDLQDNFEFGCSRSALRCGFEFHFKALLIKLDNFVIQLKHSEFSLPGLERHTEELFPFSLSYDKPCGELALF